MLTLHCSQFSPDFNFLICRINHSCCPNVLPCERQGDAVHTRALREIAEGEELFNSYIVFMQIREERRKDLGRWHFLCKCKSCSLDGEEQENDDKARAKVGWLILSVMVDFALTDD